jgi:hypothetical protein
MITTSMLSQRLPEKEPLPPWRMPVTPGPLPVTWLKSSVPPRLV